MQQIISDSIHNKYARQESSWKVKWKNAKFFLYLLQWSNPIHPLVVQPIHILEEVPPDNPQTNMSLDNSFHHLLRDNHPRNHILGSKKIFNIQIRINVFIFSIKDIKVFLLRICVLTMLIQLWSEGHSNCPTSQEAGAANAGLTSQFFASVISFEKTMLSIAAYPSLESPRNARKIIWKYVKRWYKNNVINIGAKKTPNS